MNKIIQMIFNEKNKIDNKNNIKKKNNLNDKNEKRKKENSKLINYKLKRIKLNKILIFFKNIKKIKNKKKNYIKK